MRQEEYLGLQILHVESDDQLTAIIEIVEGTLSNSLLLVLPDTDHRRSFLYPHDFHDLRTQRGPQSISLVIPDTDKQARQWAKENGFLLLFPSLDVFMDKFELFRPDDVETDLSRKTRHDPHSPLPLTSSRGTEPLKMKQSSPYLKPLLIVLCILTVLAGSFFVFVPQSAFLLHNRSVDAPMSPMSPMSHMFTGVRTNVVGYAEFESSRLYNQDGTSGVSDQVLIDLQHLGSPMPGNTYCAWLIEDKGVSDGRSLLLSTLSLHNGSVNLTYTASHHQNLLTSFSQLLITEESASMTPLVPSPDPRTWRYTGYIEQTPNPNDSRHFSLLDHLRHLLAKDPTLESLGLHSGLDYWQYKNCGKLIEWTQSARDDWGQANTSFLRRQLIRTLDYLDGTAYVYQDIPSKTPLLVDSKLLRLGLIDVSSTQTLEGFFPHIAYHLTSFSSSPGVTLQQKQMVAQVMIAINAVVKLLQQARKDAKVLLAMSDAQLHRPIAQMQLNELANLTNDAYVGNVQRGCVWIHQQIDQLAIFNVKQV